MSKISKEQQWRLEGMSYAVRYLEQGHTLEDLQTEVKFRGAYNIPLNVSSAVMNEFGSRMMAAIFDKTINLCIFVLRVRFGFGKVRCDRFMQGVADTADEIIKGDLFNWDDMRYLVEQELGLKKEATA